MSAAQIHILHPIALGRKRIEAPLVVVVDGLEELVLPWVVAAVDLGESVSHYVGVPDRALDALVAEELLDVSDARAVLQEVGRRRVAKGVGRNLLLVHVEATQEGPEPLANAV